MRFFFPDSQDQIDPGYDYEREEYSAGRARQRDDGYAHEVLENCPYDGVLVSKSVVDGLAKSAGRYTLAQRHRLFRVGVHRFFRLEGRYSHLRAMGDCGAFSYVAEPEPPYAPDAVVDFYDGCGFDYGLSLDHVILGYRESDEDIPEDWARRRELTISLAAEFLGHHRARGCRFVPIGVAQGWSPSSMARSVLELQRMGYRRVALGGMVPLKTPEILECVQACNAVRDSMTQFHLLGVTRCDHVLSFESLGVSSFDSTSPFRQAFKDDRDNYHTLGRTYTAVRVPQVDGNPKLKRLIMAGVVDQTRALSAERACLQALTALDSGEATAQDAVRSLRVYAELCGEKRDRSAAYAELLCDRPWKDCDCGICSRLGVHVVVFRGSERNKARGFHNLHVFRERLNGIHPAMATGSRTA